MTATREGIGTSEQGIFEVWAITYRGDEETRRWFGCREAAIERAERIARGSGDEGAMSVWVCGPQGVVWAAGWKAADLKSRDARSLNGQK